MQYTERVKEYQKSSGIAEDYHLAGKDKECHNLLAKQYKSAQKSGDSDYEYYFESELSFQQDIPGAIDKLKHAINWQNANNIQDAFIHTALAGNYLKIQDINNAILHAQTAKSIKQDCVMPSIILNIIFKMCGKNENCNQILDELFSSNSQDSREWRFIANQMFQLQRVEDMHVCLDKMLKLDNQNPANWIERGCLMGNTGNLLEAEKSLDKAIELDSKNWKYWNQKGYFYASMRNTLKAIVAFQEAAKLKADNHEAIKMIEKMAFCTGMFEIAEEFACRYIKLFPDCGESYLVLGTIANMKGQYEKALDILDLIKSEECTAEVWLQKTAASEKLGNIAKALEFINNGLKQNSEEPYMLALAGGYYVEMNDYDKALEMIDKSLTLNPTDHFAIRQKAVALAHIGKTIEAEITMNNGLTYGTNDFKYNLEFALLLTYNKKYDEAHEYYDKAAAIEPNNIDCHIFKGLSYFIEGNYNNARKCFISGHTLGEKAELDLLKMLVSVGLGEKITEKQITKILGKLPESYGLLYLCGAIEIKNGYLLNGIKKLEKAAKLPGSDYKVWKMLTIAYMFNGDIKNTVFCINQVLKYGKEDIETYAIESILSVLDIENTDKDLMAIEFIDKAISLDDSDFRLWHMKADICEYYGQEDLAALAKEKAFALNSEYEKWVKDNKYDNSLTMKIKDWSSYMTSEVFDSVKLALGDIRNAATLLLWKR